MTFQFIMRNRLGTEERVGLQMHLDVVNDVMNRQPPVPKAKMELEVLRTCEQRQDQRPFPHNVAVDSIGAQIEDMVFFCPGTWHDLDAPSNHMLGEWITEMYSDRQDQETLYYIVRQYFNDELNEYVRFDLDADANQQATFLLLVAHAYFFENEERK